MANNCSACNDLQRNAPEFYTNGVTTNVCTSLKNNTGLNPANGNDNDTDIQDVTACLVGNMESEIKAYDVCDWKEFMKKLIPNLFNTFEVLRCAIGGIWSAITSLRNASSKHECLINALFDGTNYTFTKDQFIEGTGVTMISDSATRSSMTLRVKGNVYRVHGGVNFDHANWSNLGLTNAGGARGKMNPSDGGYRVGILKIKKSDYPEIRTLYATQGQFTNAGIGNVTIYVVDGDATDVEDRYYPAQWGWTDPDDHTKDNLVPSGYIYVCILLTGLVTWGFTGNTKPKVTIDALGMAGLNKAEVKC